MMIIDECGIDYAEYIFLLEKNIFDDYWSLNTISKSLSDNRYLWLCCFYEGEFAGYLCTSYVLDEANIERIAVKDKFRRMGIAENLLKSFFAKTNCKKVFLEVRSKNYAAMQLYEKYNFCKLSVRKNYYRAPIDDAVIMTREL